MHYNICDFCHFCYINIDLSSYTVLIRYLWLNEYVQINKNFYVSDGILLFVSDSLFSLPKIQEITVEFRLHSDYIYPDKYELYSFQFIEYNFNGCFLNLISGRWSKNKRECIRKKIHNLLKPEYHHKEYLNLPGQTIWSSNQWERKERTHCNYYSSIHSFHHCSKKGQI